MVASKEVGFSSSSLLVPSSCELAVSDGNGIPKVLESWEALPCESPVLMLDGYDYLVKRGWEGKGTALRPGGLSRPIIIGHKKTLGGVGNDRDEAFPFWEHIFNASVNAIKIKISSDSATDSDAEEEKVHD